MANSSSSSKSELLLEQMSAIIGENQTLQESLNNVMTMFAREDIGWLKLSGSGWDAEENGLSLEDLQDWSLQIREAMAGNPWIKQGWNLRSTFVFEGGVHRDNIPGSERGRGIDVQSRVDHPTNQKNFFSPDACHEREGSLYSDSQPFYVGDETDYTIHNVPIWEITGDVRNPEYSDEVWAYRRSYMVPVNASGQREVRVEWIYRNGYLDKRPRGLSINYNGINEPVSKTKRMFGNPVNSQIGWAYGVPDALAALIWARIYRDAMMDGRTMTQALASLAFNVTSGSKTAGENAAVKFSQAGVAGTSILGAGNELNALSSAGKAYDFDALRPILAAAAAALQVSVVALASDPGAAGSSYGSAQTLDLPSRLAIAARRQYHVALETEVLKWMGAKDPHVWFDSLEDASAIYRKLQAWVLKWNSGLYKPEDAKKELEAIFGREFADGIPEGVLIPNNEASWERSDIDPKGAPGSNPTQAGGAGQGQANGTGGQGGGMGNDIREALGAIQATRIEEMLQELLDRMNKRG